MCFLFSLFFCVQYPAQVCTICKVNNYIIKKQFYVKSLCVLNGQRCQN